MTRRAAAGLGRALPSLLIATAIAAVLVTAGLAACGGAGGGDSPEPTATIVATPSDTASASGSASASPAPSPTTRTLTPVTLYFIRDGAVCAVERRLEDASEDAVVRALLRGPTAEEQAAGVTTRIPRGVRLLEIAAGDGAAQVDLSAAFAKAGDAAGVRARMAQVVYTVTAMRTEGVVARVTLHVGGVPIDGLPSNEGDVEYYPARAGYRELEPAIFVERPGLGAAMTSPFTLRGSASVFEGSFTARLVDGSGRRIVSVTVQASRGAPGRGRFSKEIAFSTSAADGTLIVYSQSMEDGSRQNEVRIPVEFTQD